MRRVIWAVLAGLVAIVAVAVAAAPRTEDAWGEDRSGAIVSSADCTQHVIPRNDDSYSSTVALPFKANFYGQGYEQLWVNNNGNVTFDGPMSTFTPFTIAAARRAIIAPFFGDVDTRASGSDVVRYGWGETTYEGRRAFCVNWLEVGYYEYRTEKRNSFQLLLVDRRDVGPGDFDIVFNYGSVQWEAGNASGGSAGLGGASARVGFANGDGSADNSFELPGSGINGRLLDSHPEGLIHGSLGTKQRGRYVWQVRNGKPNPNGPPVAKAGDDVEVDEGDVARLDASASTDPDGDPLQYKWSRLRGTGPNAPLSSTTTARPTLESLDDAEADFRVTVDDGKGEASSDDVTVRTRNVAPTVSAADVSGSERGATVLAATYADPGLLDDHTATVDWGDGTKPERAAVTPGAGWGSLVAAHRYARAGTYRAKVTVADDDGGQASAESEVTIASPPAIWADSRIGGPAIEWTGSRSRIRGLVHSNSDIRIGGTEHRVDGRTEHVTDVRVTGNQQPFTTPPARVAAAEAPVRFALNDFRPGGRVHREVGDRRFFDRTAACERDGVWSAARSGETLPTGVYWVPCRAELSGSDLRGEVTIAASGAIKVSGSGIEARAHADGVLLLSGHTGNEAIHVSGSSARLTGYLAAPLGEVQLSGAGLRQSCGVLADRIKLSGTSLALAGTDCTRPRAAVALSSLVPSPKVGLTVDRDTARPGDELTYRATVTNAGATLVASGLIGAENVGDTPATVASYAYALEYLPAEGGDWVPVAGAARSRAGYTPRETPAIDRGVTLATHPMAAPGVRYEGSGIIDAALSPGTLAAWGYQARVQLTPAQVRLLGDPERVRAVRNVMHLELVGSQHTRELYRYGDDFSAKLRADGGDLEDASVTVAPPAGDPIVVTKDDDSRLARVAPGDAVTLDRGWTVPAPAARAESEPSASYVERLKAADGGALRAAARARMTAGRSRLIVPQQLVSTTRRLPVVSLDKDGPPTLRPSATASYDLRLENAGSAGAQAVQVTDTVVGRGAATVTGAPSELAPGAAATARASHTAPSSGSSVADVGAVTWKDANGTAYGPVDERFTTRLVAPSNLSVTKFDWLDEDADGDGIASPGDVIEYEVAVENTGSETLSDVTMHDRVDPGTRLLVESIRPSQGSVAATEPDLRVAFGTVPGRRTVTARFKVRVTESLPAGRSTVSNQARVTATGRPEVLSDDRGEPGAEDPTVTRVRSRLPQLELAKSARLAVDRDGDGQPSPGDTLAYLVDLRNAGDAAATGVVVTDRPGAHLTLEPGSVETSGGHATVADGALRVEIASLGARAGEQIALKATVAERLPSGVDRVANQAFADSHQTARVASDDPGTDAPDATSTQLALKPRLDADKVDTLLEDRDGNGVASPGDRLRYDITVRNASGTDATAVEVADRPDPNTTLVAGSAAASQGTVQEADGAVFAHLGALAPGAQATVSLVAEIHRLPEGTWRVRNQARVASAELAAAPSDDPDVAGAADPTATDVVATAAAPPLLTVKKRDTLAIDADGDGRPSPGDTLSYEITVWNAGAGSATGVTLTDQPDANAPLIAGSVQAPADAEVLQGNATGDTAVKVRFAEIHPSSGVTTTYQARIAQVLPAGVTTVGSQAEATSSEAGTVGSYDPDGASGGATATELAVPPAATPGIGAVAPADGAVVTAPVDVRAALTPPSGQSIATWCVKLRLAGDDGAPARTLRCGTGTPPDVLTRLDPTVLVNGTYVLTVEATATGGGVQRESTTLSVQGDLKVGRFTQTYRDFTVPLHGLPIEVLRTYDSTDKAKGDFGVGWNVSVANVRVQANRRLGRGGWSHQASGCTILLGQSICLSRDFQDLSSHFVTVNWPDGRTEVFDFTPHAGSGGIYYDASAAFTARRGTTSTLVPVGDPTLQYWGDGNLYEGDGETLYDPKRFKLTTKDGTEHVLDVDEGLVSSADRSGNTLTIDDDGVTSSTGRSVRFTRDGLGRITRITGPAGEQRTYSYDARGDLEATSDGRGNPTRFTYDGDHNLLGVKDPQGRPTRTLRYDEDGRLASITDGEGNVTDVDTDVEGRQEIVTSPDRRLTTITTFDERGNPVEVKEAAEGTTRTQSFAYDDADRLVKVVDPAGKATTNVYDGASNLVSTTDAAGRTTRFEYDWTNAIVKTIAPDGMAVVIERDESGDPVRIDEGSGRVTQLAYDRHGRVTGETDPMGRQYTTVYDAAGNPTEMRGPSGVARATYDASSKVLTQTDETGATTTFGYDADGRLASVRDPRTGTRTFTYDAHGRLETEKDALGAVTRHAYDLAGRRSSTTDRTGAVTTFSYDAAGRPTGRSGAGEELSVQYDALGRMTRTSNRDAVMTFRLDERDLVTSVTTEGVPGSGLPSTTVAYTYDAAGEVETMDGPGGLRRYRYDAAGRLAELVDSSTGTFRFGRDALGRLSTLSRPNGVTTHMAYNAAGETTDVVHRSAAGVLDEAHYAYDGRGLRTEVRDGNGTWSYDYDPAGQLTSAAGEAFSYDAGGNRTGSGEVYDAANRLLRDAEHTYDYDGEGRLRSRTDSAGRTVRFAWNADGSLRSVERPDGAVTRYRYDPLGRRIEVAGAGGTKRTGYGTDANALVEYDAANAVRATFAFGPGLDAPLVMQRGAATQYYLQDALSSVTALTTASGAVSQRYRYSAYGKPLHAPDATGNPYTYTGREWDAESATYHYRARSYDPAAGRFLSEDPIRALNPYAYATNNPMTFRDPTGEFSMPEQQAAMSTQEELQAAQQTHMHHTVPRQILKMLEQKSKQLTPKDKNFIRGKQGCPNRWAVAIDHHIDIHRGKGGGAYNDAWIKEIEEVYGWGSISVDHLLDIREALTKRFKLDPPDPDYFSRCRGMR